jgi:pimeloyl-ACP methyl ester carboxylesterase
MTVGSKLFFTAEERLRMQEIAAKPARLFDSEAEAVLRYRKVAGLEPSSGALERHLSRGVRKVDAGWRLSQDPAVNGIVVPSFAQMLTDARCPVLAAAGERDAMVPMAQLRALLPAAVQFDNAGHNVHVESPEALLRVLETLSA